jgi:methionine-rich copper-binding protein CopC
VLAVVVCLFLSQSAFVVFKHVHLVRSDPIADSTVTAAPTAIRFWFSAPVQLSVTSVRLTDASGQRVETAAPRAGQGAGMLVIADVRGRLAPGRATVAWRTMSRDGHVASGAFAFMLAPPAAPRS